MTDSTEGSEAIEPKALTDQLKDKAHELGFPLVGVTIATSPNRLHHFHRWLENGYAGSMLYLDRRREAYEHPSSILEGCRTLVMLGSPYLTSSDQRSGANSDNNHGKVARYAQCGQDYHDVIRSRLKQLKKWLIDQRPAAKVRGVVDTAPLMERDFAESAGLGWVGKNTLLLNKRWGSYFFLAALLTDLRLQPDRPHETSHCGTCTACLDNCPTKAFPQPFVLDATRCISYLTIEYGGAVPEELSQMGNGWIFGCDICQEVCPWNRKSLTTDDSEWQPKHELASLDVLSMLRMNREEFELRFRKTPLWRSGHQGMLRNAILVAGWNRMSETTDDLVRFLDTDDKIIRGSAAWALGQIGGLGATNKLEFALGTEEEAEVRDTIVQALSNLKNQVC